MKGQSSSTLKGTLINTLAVELIKIGTAVGAKLLVRKLQQQRYEQLPWWKKVFTPYPK